LPKPTETSGPVRPEPEPALSDSPELAEGEGRTDDAPRSPLLPLTDEDLRCWLREEFGIAEYRRIVRDSDNAIVISKFEPGFSQELFATVDLLPELFDDETVAAEYHRLAESHAERPEARLRTAVWREASEGVLNRLCAARGIDEQRRMFVLPGIESVQAVMDTILWSAPRVDQKYQPSAGEVQAYEESQVAAMADLGPGTGHDMFTRFYGALDGRPVENYCPGAQFGRRLVAQAWRICAGL